MQSTERQKFEESWKSAFEGAEMTPSDNVWNSIEVGLAGAESARMKKRVVFYQRVAAATIGVALITGLYAFYLSNGTNEQLADASKPNTLQPTQPEKTNSSSNQETPQAIDHGGGPAASQSEPRLTSGAATQPTTPTGQQFARLNNVTTVNNDRFTKYQIKNAAGFVPASVPNLEVTWPGSVAFDSTYSSEPTTEVIAQEPVSTTELVAELSPDKSQEKQGRKTVAEGFWVAIGGAAGNYAPNSAATQTGGYLQATGVAKASDSFAGSGPRSNPSKVGYAYTIGMAAGKRFGRVIVQSGVNLVKQEIEYTSNYAAISTSNTAAASVAEYQASSLQLTNEYKVASSIDIVSIPVQVGYLIVDRRVGWQMNAGVSSDFFLRNTLVDKSGQQQSYTQGAGDSSPYRSVNWSGLVNTELSYRLGTNFRLSLVPGVRYSFQTLLKDPANSGKPIILDVGLRLRYVIK